MAVITVCTYWFVDLSLRNILMANVIHCNQVNTETPSKTQLLWQFLIFSPGSLVKS